MKTAKSITIAFLIITSFSGSSRDVFAQDKLVTPPSEILGQIEKINGNDMIDRLANQRVAFNKNRLKNVIPKAEYLINRNNLTLISFNGLDYYVKNNRVIGIRGLNLSDSVLEQITAKLVLLDSIQFEQSERLNNEYTMRNTDVKKIWYINRQFMLTLKMLSSTVRDIAAFTKNENPSLTVELNVTKMRSPNVNKAATNQDTQSLVSLLK